MSKPQPLDDLEIFELLQAAYPEKFPDDEDATWEAAMEFADTFGGLDAFAELMGRVVLLTIPVESPLTGAMYHTLGEMVETGGTPYLRAAVRRPYSPGSQSS